jgi:hypothetical protein
MTHPAGCGTQAANALLEIDERAEACDAGVCWLARVGRTAVHVTDTTLVPLGTLRLVRGALANWLNELARCVLRNEAETTTTIDAGAARLAIHHARIERSERTVVARGKLLSRQIERRMTAVGPVVAIRRCRSASLSPAGFIAPQSSIAIGSMIERSPLCVAGVIELVGGIVGVVDGVMRPVEVAGPRLPL